MRRILRYRKQTAILVSIILLIILAGYAPWPTVIDILSDLSPGALIGVIAWSTVYYAIKVLRFWYMFKALGIHSRLLPTALWYLGAQPVTLLPAGELYRSRLAERFGDIPLQKSLPTFTMQGMMEGAGMAIVGLVSALALGHLRVPVLVLAALVLTTFLAVRRGQLKTILRWANAIPFVSIGSRRLQSFSAANQSMLKGKNFFIILLLSIAAEVAGGLVAYSAVTGLGGHISLAAAMLTYIIPVIIGFISLLPGGFGANEQGSVAILLLSKVPLSIAVAATLIIRVSLVGIGLLYGLISYSLLRQRNPGR